MIKRNGIYYMMWSEGGWGGPDYAVSYAMSGSPSARSTGWPRSSSRTPRWPRAAGITA